MNGEGEKKREIAELVKKSEEERWWEEYYRVAEDPEKAKKLREREEEIARRYGLPWENFSLELAEQLGAKYPPTIRNWGEYWKFVEELARRNCEKLRRSRLSTLPDSCRFIYKAPFS